MKLYELNNSTLDYLTSIIPDIPKYIVQDMVYRPFKSMLKAGDRKNALEYAYEMKETLSDYTWKEETILLHLRNLAPTTRRIFHSRAGGSEDPLGVPNDKERHETQWNLLQQRGISTEPIIVAYDDGKYDVWEGWHRMMQYFNMYPNGFEVPAWVGYPK
jgi:hypothetical protein